MNFYVYAFWHNLNKKIIKTNVEFSSDMRNIEVLQI